MTNYIATCLDCDKEIKVTNRFKLFDFKDKHIEHKGFHWRIE